MGKDSINRNEYEILWKNFHFLSVMNWEKLYRHSDNITSALCP